ncbi:MAG: 2-amino-4-hydroxy-6-hydroxymethyldihydropteridine diphosphokinase [Polyangiaceae bacterium]
MALRAVVGFGANLGDRLATMRVALVELSRATHVERTSHVYATAAIGGVPQGEFLNAAALVLHDGTPGRLLEVLLEIEQRLGRVRREKWGPRNIDLDLLWVDGVALESERLTLPHPQLRFRAFALVPMLELVPNATDPTTQERYVAPPGDVQATDEIL